MNEPMTLSVLATARLLGISRGVCYRLCKEPDSPLKALRLGKKLRIPRAAVERMLQVKPKSELPE